MKNIAVFEIVFKIFVLTVLGIIVFKQLDNNKSIAYVDSVKLISQYEGMKSAKKELESKISVWKANVDSLGREFQTEVGEYEKKKSKLSKNEQALTEQLLTTKQQQLMNYQQSIEEKIRKEDQELTAKVLGKVNDYIKQYGEKEGYEIIMAATQVGNIVYAKKEMDITDDIIAGLNKGF